MGELPLTYQPTVEVMPPAIVVEAVQQPARAFVFPESLWEELQDRLVQEGLNDTIIYAHRAPGGSDGFDSLFSAACSTGLHPPLNTQPV